MMHLGRRTLLAGAGALGTGLAARNSRAQASGPIRIGFVSPLSGPAGSVGAPVRIGAEAGRDWLNSQGGIGGRQVELVIMDDGGSPNRSVAAYRELASQGVTMIVGPTLTATAFAVAGVLDELKCCCITTGTPDEKLTHENFNKYLFVGAHNGYTRQHAAARAMATRFPDVTAWTGLITDGAAGQHGWDSFVKALRAEYPAVAKKAVTVVEPITAKTGATDYRQQAAALLASQGKAFWMNLFGNDGITFYQQARQLDLYRHFAAIIDYGIDIDLPKTLKHNVPTNVWTSSYWYYGAYKGNPIADQLVQVYEKATGSGAVNGFAQCGNTAVIAYGAAIRAAGGATDADSVARALGGLKFDSGRGRVQFRAEDHQLADTRLELVRWEPADGEPGWKEAEVVSVEDKDVINPPAPGKPWVE